MYGQKPSTTLMPLSSQKATADLLTAPGAMPPYIQTCFTPGLGAVVHDLLGDLGRGHDQDAIDRGLDVLDPLVAGLAVDLGAAGLTGMAS